MSAKLEITLSQNRSHLSREKINQEVQVKIPRTLSSIAVQHQHQFQTYYFSKTANFILFFSFFPCRCPPPAWVNIVTIISYLMRENYFSFPQYLHKKKIFLQLPQFLSCVKLYNYLSIQNFFKNFISRQVQDLLAKLGVFNLNTRRLLTWSLLFLVLKLKDSACGSNFPPTVLQVDHNYCT